MKRKQFLILVIIFAIMGSIGAYFLVEDLSLEWATTGFRSPQSGTYSEQQIANKVYNNTYGAYQGYVVGRGVTTPQSGTYSTSQIANKAYNDTYGAWQMYINEPLDLSYLNLSSTTPYLKMHNTTEEDTDGGRESDILWWGEQSGGERSTLARIRASHDGTSDDQKGKLEISVNDGNDNDTPTLALTIDSNGNTIFPQEESVAAPTLAFGDGDTGFYEQTDGKLGISTEGALHFFFQGATFGGNTTRASKLYDNAGSASTPSLYYVGDSNTGIYSPGADQFAITTGGTQAVFINSSSEFHANYGIVPAAKGSDPCGSGFPEGAIFWNMSSHYLCVCDGSNDVQVSDGSACF